MTDLLTRLLAEKPVLLADGATGTTYFELGLFAGEAPESWLRDEPGKVKAVHKAFVDAGADIILANSFGANRYRLKLHGLEDDTRALNRLAAQLAREVADAAGRPVVVGGSMGPTGELFQPLGALTPEAAVEAFTEQAQGLKEGGADVAWIETMSSAEEIEAAARGAIAAGLPYVFTASFDTVGRTMMGVTPQALADIAARLPVPPVAFGANCGVGPGDLVASILAMTESAPGTAIVAKGNCGIPVLHGDHVHYGGTPELMADYARLARGAGARIVGGCCGTSAAHIAAMRAALDAPSPDHRPSLEEVEAALGPVARPKETEGRVRSGRRARSSAGA